METSPVAAPAPKPARNNTWLVGVVGGLLALCVCVVLAAAGLFIADPFGWHILERAQGRYDPLAYAVPDDAMIYGSVDLLQLQSPNLKKVMEAFANVPTLAEADANKSFDENLQENWGLSLTDDILPWAGQYVGFTVHDLEMRSTGGVRSGQIVLFFEARDAAQAQAFIPKFTAAATDKHAAEYTETSYQGVTLHLVAEESETPLNIAFSNGLVILSNNADALKATIDAQQTPTEQLANTAAFKKDLADRSKQYLVYFYLPGAGVQKYFEQSAQALPNFSTVLQGLEALDNMSIVLSAAEDGLRLDSNIAYDESKLSADQKATLQYGLHEATLQHLPANTLAYVITQKLNLAWPIMVKNSQDPEALEDSMAAVEKQFGFNPAEDLIPYLDGDLALALVPDDTGMMVQAYDLNMGLVALAETTQGTELQATLEKFNSHMEDAGLPPKTEELAGVEAYTIGPRGADPLFVYGLPEGWLALATSTGAFSDAYDGGESLAENATHKAAWANFPAGTIPTFYMDIQGLVKIWRASKMADDTFEEKTLPYLEPLVSFAAGATPLQDGVAHSTMSLRIQKP